MAKQGDTDRPAFTETLRAIDDSELDVYEFRLMVHIWRVGVSWESMRTMAKKCGMSLGKIQQAQKSLIDKGHLVHESRGGRMGLTVSVRSPGEQVQQGMSSERSSHERTQQLIGSTRSPHEQNVHHMNAILNQPLKSTNKNNDRTPLETLRNHFTNQTTIQPNDRTGTYERDWVKPLEGILAHANGDAAAACLLIDEALAVARGKNERGKSYPVASPRSIATIAANLAAAGKVTATNGDIDTVWQQVRAALSNGFNTAPPPLQTAMRAVGWPRIKEAKERDVPQLKQEVFNAYRNTATV